jgi:uncharacterized protein YktB (UPF0637 family)
MKSLIYNPCSCKRPKLLYEVREPITNMLVGYTNDTRFIQFNKHKKRLINPIDTTVIVANKPKKLDKVLLTRK